MSSQIETDLTECFNQMMMLEKKIDQLQKEKKIDQLQKDKNDKKNKELEKQQHIGPNMKVLSNWLNNSGSVDFVALFQKTAHTSESSEKVNSSQVPTEFMKEYIQATHNLFNIQQKRIDLLVGKIESMEMEWVNCCSDYLMEDPRRRTD